MEKYERKSDGFAKRGVSEQRVSRQVTCKRCGGLFELTALLPKRLDSPAYKIFRCGGCDFIDWVAQDVS